MNGVEHFATAEGLLVLADSPAGASMLADGINCTAQAQVHATLALAAAVAADRSIGPVESWGGQTVSADMRDQGSAYS